VQRFSLHQAGLLLLTCFVAPLQAQDKPADYPRRPIRIVVGIAPGGGLAW
jgi:tripartite-type tricarboxylate transporter receptor subunit TctC